VGVVFCPVAIDDRIVDDVRVVWVCAADGDGLALKVDITIALAGISTWLDFDNITIVRIIYCCLDVVEICGAIIVNGDYPCLAGNGHQKVNKSEN